MKTFIHDLAKFLSGTMCQVCYKPMEIIDVNGTWCSGCHKAYTDGLVNPVKRISIVDLIKKNRKAYEEYTDDAPIVPVESSDAQKRDPTESHKKSKHSSGKKN